MTRRAVSVGGYVRQRRRGNSILITPVKPYVRRKPARDISMPLTDTGQFIKRDTASGSWLGPRGGDRHEPSPTLVRVAPAVRPFDWLEPPY